MIVELGVETIAFKGMCIDAESLESAICDPNHFYRFSNDGESITIEKYELTDLESLVQK